MINELISLRKQAKEIGYEISDDDAMSVYIILVYLIDILIKNEESKMDDFK